MARATPRKKVKGEWVKVMIRLNRKGQRVSFGSHVIEAKYWDTDLNHIKQLRGNDDLAKKRRHIEQRRAYYEEQWEKLHALKGDFTAAEFKAFLEGDLDPVRNTRMDFLPWVTKFIHEFDQRPKPGGTKAGAEATKKKYLSDLKILEQFAADQDEELSWENMDARFCNEMRKWRAQLPANHFRPGYSHTSLTSEGTIGRMDLSRQLLVQSAANLDTVIQADMTNAIANKLDEDMIGDIFSQLETAGNITDGSTGSGTSATATDYLDLTNHEGGFLSQNPSGQNLAMLMDPTMASFLKQVSQSSGGAILNSGNEILGYPVFTSTNAATQTVVADTYFSGITDTNDTISIRPIFFLDPADIFYAVFGQLDVTIDPYTSAHTGVVRLIADYYADGAIRRTGSGRILAGLTANTTPTTV